MDNCSEKRILRCEEAAAMLEERDGGAENPALAEHLAGCADCRALARILELSASLAAEVPPGLTDSVMKCVRTERARQTSRMRWIRRIGTAAAAAVLVPAVVIFAPILFGADDASTKETVDRSAGISTAADAYPETVPETAAGENDSTVQAYSETVTAPVMMMAPPPPPSDAGAPEAPPEGNPTTGAPPAGPAPSYVKQPGPEAPQTSFTTMALDDLKSLRPIHAVLVTLIGADAADALDEEDPASAAALCFAYGITREDFCAAAEALELTFTDAEIAEIFG